MKTPPRYGKELSEMTRKLFQYSLIIHLGFAFFMFSNTNIFSDEQTLLIERENKEYKTFLGSLFKSSTRLYQKHSQIYISFLIAIYIIFFIYKIAEYLFETFSQNNREASRRFCSFRIFKSLKILCRRNKPQ